MVEEIDVQRLYGCAYADFRNSSGNQVEQILVDFNLFFNVIEFVEADRTCLISSILVNN